MQTKTLTKEEYTTMQGMADCMDMVRQELIEAGIIDNTVAPMFIANAVHARIKALEDDSKRFAACRHQSRYMQEDGGEKAFVAAVDAYRKQNGL